MTSPRAKRKAAENARRSPAKRLRSFDDEEESGSSDGIFVRETGGVRFNSQKQSMPQLVEQGGVEGSDGDGDGEEDGSQSQEFLALVEKESRAKRAVAEKSREFVMRFGVKAREEEGVLVGSVRGWEDAVKQSDSAFRTSFRDAFLASAPFSINAHGQPTPTAFSALQDESTALAAKALSLISLFNTVSAKVTAATFTGVREPPEEVAKAFREVEELLDDGMEVGTQRVEMLVRNLRIPRMDAQGRVREVSERLFPGFEEGMADGVVVGRWGKELARQEKGVRKMLGVARTVMVVR